MPQTLPWRIGRRPLRRVILLLCLSALCVAETPLSAGQEGEGARRRRSSPRISGVTSNIVAQKTSRTYTVYGLGFQSGLRPSIGTASSVTSHAIQLDRYARHTRHDGSSGDQSGRPDFEHVTTSASRLRHRKGNRLRLLHQRPLCRVRPPRRVTSNDGRSVSVTYPAPLVTGGTYIVRTMCTPASGAMFAVGTTTVSCVAAGEEQARITPCSFPVTVTTAGTVPPPTVPPPPTIACPFNQTASSSDGNPVVVNYPAPTVSGGLAPLSTTCSPVSGSKFPVGNTAVRCTTTDSLNRAAACQSLISVIGPSSQPPSVTGYSISGTPPRVGASSTYVGTARMSNGSSQPIDPSLAQWQSSNPNIATWMAPGLLQGVSAGTVTVQSTYQGVAASQNVTTTGQSTPPPPSPPPSSGRRLIVQSDITYLGSYDDLDGTGWGQGVTHRYVNGEFRLLTLRGGSRLEELRLPASFGGRLVSTNVWSDIFSGAAGLIGQHKGIWFEEATQRLWTGDAIDYPDDSQAQMGMLASPTTRTAQRDGRRHQRISSASRCKASALGKRTAIRRRRRRRGSISGACIRIMIGWGGYASRMAQGWSGDRSIGPVSMGLSVIGIPDLAGYANNGRRRRELRRLCRSRQRHVGRAPSASVDRGVRNSDVINYFDSGDPRTNPSTPPSVPPASGARWLSPAADGLGRWPWGDSFWHTGMAIDTGDKYGLVLVGSFLSGKAYY